MITPTAHRMLDRVRRLLLVAALGLIVCGPLAAQCAMCRESAAYQRHEAVDALKRGILVLGFPPLAIVVGIACLTYRHRGTHGGPDGPVRSTGNE
jgi:hypothetical protein